MSLNRRNEERLQVFERRILRKIFGPICDNEKWRIRYNSELYSIYTDPDIIKTNKISKLRWTGRIMRMPEENAVKELTLLRQEGSRRAGRLKLRWLDGVEEVFRTLGIRGWRRRVLDRDRWKEVLTAGRALKRAVIPSIVVLDKGRGLSSLVRTIGQLFD